MMEKIFKYLRLEDDCELNSADETDSEEGGIVLKTILRSFIAWLYLLAIMIEPIYKINGMKFCLRDIYKNILGNMNWDLVALVNMIMLAVILVAEFVEKISTKKSTKIISAILSAIGLLIILLTALPAPVYGRIELIKAQSIGIELGAVAIPFLFLMIAMPMLIRIVTGVNLWIFRIWCENGEKPSTMRSAIVYIAELVIAMLVLREIFVIAVSTFL